MNIVVKLTEEQDGDEIMIDFFRIRYGDNTERAITVFKDLDWLMRGNKK